jgi:formamidopyrimidine-DNA glycosylase
MPELPEVETVVRTLRPGLIGRRITGVDLCSNGATDGRASRALRQVLVTPVSEFRRSLRGPRVDNVQRYGKNILIELRASESTATLSLLIHLGMTGRLLWEVSPAPQRPHTHCIFSLDAPGRWLHYSDPRRFGKMRTVRARPAELSELGPDPLEISLDEFCRRLRRRRAMVKSLLLDQRFLRGLGNIYADESLFRAEIHPATLASRLSRRRAMRLYDSIRETLQAAIALGGSSVSDYVNADGNTGWFQQEHAVYLRTGQPCLRCEVPIRRMVIAGRGTHYCPRCQRATRAKTHKGTGRPAGRKSEKR